MNNGAVFAIGALVGAAAGSVATYFIVKEKFEQKAADEIEAYAEHAEERLQNYISSHFSDAEIDPDDSEESNRGGADVPVDDEDAIERNPGVKKYHHYQSGFIPEKEEEVTEGQKDILEHPELDDVFGVDEITSEEFDLLDDDEYTRVYLSYNANTDELKTNEDEIAEEAYSKTRSELIGNCWRWATDYFDESSGEGDFWIKNDNLKIAFQVGIIFDPDAEMVEVG